MANCLISTINKVGSQQEDKHFNVGVLPNTSNAENIYYYAFFRNSTDKDVLAEYSEKRSQFILNKLADYKMAVLSLDLGDIDTPYFISNEFPLTFQLRYPPDGLTSTQTLFAGVPTEITSYEQLLEEYNRLLDVAWNDIINQYNLIHGPGSWQANILLPQGVPGITFDSNNDLFTIWMDERSAEGNPNAVLWYSEAEFIRLFQGARMNISNTPLNSRFIFNVTFANSNIQTVSGIDYIKNIQQYSSGSNWSTIRELLVVTHTLSCRKEYIGGSQQSSQALLRDVIGNYPVSISNIEGGVNPSSRIIIYNLVGTPRWIDLFGDNELYQLDFSLFYLTSTGRIVQVTIKPGQSFGIKVMFVKQVF